MKKTGEKTDMVNMFVNKMCNYCLNDNCNKKIKVLKKQNCTIYKCDEYIKNIIKIVPYQEPLAITAERDYVARKEI